MIKTTFAFLCFEIKKGVLVKNVESRPKKLCLVFYLIPISIPMLDQQIKPNNSSKYHRKMKKRKYQILDLDAVTNVIHPMIALTNQTKDYGLRKRVFSIISQSFRLIWGDRPNNFAGIWVIFGAFYYPHKFCHCLHTQSMILLTSISHFFYKKLRFFIYFTETSILVWVVGFGH